jgi:hypothetical protein
VIAEDGARWRQGDEPYGTFIRGMLRAGEPAVLHLPAACRRWQNDVSELYDIRCIAGRSDRAQASGTSARGVLPRADGVPGQTPFAAR